MAAVMSVGDGFGLWPRHDASERVPFLKRPPLKPPVIKNNRKML